MHKGWVNGITNDLIFSDDITLKKIRLQSDLIFFFQKLICLKKDVLHAYQILNIKLLKHIVELCYMFVP